MAKARGPTPGPGPGPGPALAGKPTRKKSKKRWFWENRARGAAAPPGRAPGSGVGRPPKAPEDFSQNWRALQELLKQKSQAPEKPLHSQMNPKKQPRVAQHDGRLSENTKREETGTEEPEQAARGGLAPPGSLPGRKGPAPPTLAHGAKNSEPRVPKRAHNGPSAKRGDIKHKKRKTGAVPTAPAPAPPTEDDIWFDDVDPEDIEAAIGPEAAQVARRQLGQSQSPRGVTLVKEQAFGGLTRALALDCEMVGVGPKGEESVAARVSLVNQFGKCVYDKYVRPTQPVTDYRTAVSGIRPEQLVQGEELNVVQKEVAGLLRGRVLVGHALQNDLKVLLLDHPKKKIRDTQKYKPFKSQVKSGRPSLKLLARKILGVGVQEAEHCSVQDAQAAMRLYVAVKKEWEGAARSRRAAAPPEAETTPSAPAAAGPRSACRIKRL